MYRKELLSPPFVIFVASGWMWFECCCMWEMRCGSNIIACNRGVWFECYCMWERGVASFLRPWVLWSLSIAFRDQWFKRSRCRLFKNYLSVFERFLWAVLNRLDFFPPDMPGCCVCSLSCSAFPALPLICSSPGLYRSVPWRAPKLSKASDLYYLCRA